MGWRCSHAWMLPRLAHRYFLLFPLGFPDLFPLLSWIRWSWRVWGGLAAPPSPTDRPKWHEDRPAGVSRPSQTDICVLHILDQGSTWKCLIRGFSALFGFCFWSGVVRFRPKASRSTKKPLIINRFDYKNLQNKTEPKKWFSCCFVDFCKCLVGFDWSL